MEDRGYVPTIIVFSDTDEGIATASDQVAANGGRVRAALPIGEAMDRLDVQISVDLVVLDVSQDHGALLDQLFRRINDGVARRRFAAIVIVAPELLDIVATWIEDPGVVVLIGRDAEGIGLATSEVLFRVQPQLREASDDGDLGRAQFPSRHGDYDEESGSEAETVDAQSPEAAAIREMIRARRLRDELFGRGLFADPAWDILLDLTAARIERRSVAVSSLCIAAAVPATTALRWIKQLTESGLLRRVADPDDGRRVFIELTDRTAEVMTTYFTALSRGGRG